MTSKFLRLIFLVGTALISGCTPFVKYYVNPNDATVVKSNGQAEHATQNPVVAYPEVKKEDFNNGACPIVDTPTIVWSDGIKLAPYKIRICSINNSYRINKPVFAAPQNNPPATIQPAKPVQGSDLGNAKNKCNELGFKMGTEAFGNCVLKISK